MAQFVKDEGRLKHVRDRGHTTKMHAYIQICGNLGAYAVLAAATLPDEANRLPMAAALAIILLFQAMGELWPHSLHRSEIVEAWQIDAPKMIQFLKGSRPN